MFSTAVSLSGTAMSVTPMLGELMLFAAFFAITILMFAAALIRQTIITALLSTVLWFGLSFSVWLLGEATSGITQGSSYTFMGLGFVMLVITLYFTFESLKEAAAEKQRRVSEEII